MNDFALFTNTSAQHETVDKDIAVNVYWKQETNSLYACN